MTDGDEKDDDYWRRVWGWFKTDDEEEEDDDYFLLQTIMTATPQQGWRLPTTRARTAMTDNDDTGWSHLFCADGRAKLK
jgi:hypothetical protein